MKVKVLWICSPLASRYGVMNIICGWASRFDYSRYDVTLLYSSPDPDGVKERLAAFPQIKVEWMPELSSLRRLYVPAILGLKKRMRADGVEVVHTVFVQADILGAIAGHLAGVPAVVSSVMGYLVVPVGSAGVKTTLYKAVYGVARRWIDRVTAITNTTSRELTREFGVPDDKIEVVYSGIPLNEYPRESRNDGLFLIGSVGQLIPKKGTITAIEALPEVLREIAGARLLIAGDGPERERLELRAFELGVLDRIEFLGFSENVPQLMARLDAFVFSSFPGYDGLPRVILEAMLQRTPVIAARTEPIEEIVMEERTGRLFPPGDAQSLARAIICVARQTEMTARFVERAHEMVMKFSVENEVCKIQDLYRKVLESKRRGAV